jgi:kynurenine formamidase
VSPSLARRRALAILAATPVVAAMTTGGASAAPTPAVPPGIPAGFRDVDPRTARRVPLTQPLAADTPIFPGDPAFEWSVFTTVPEDGYLLEHITSLGTHTGTHVSAPVHFVEGAKYLDQIGEGWTLMPLVVLDVKRRVDTRGGDFTVGRDDLLALERRTGRIPAGGCVLLYTGFSSRFSSPAPGEGPYFDPAPGFTAAAAGWLFEQRGIRALGSDTFGPDATSDEDFGATLTALQHGGITVENVGPGLGRMRAYGDWISINGGRPHFSGFQTGITGFTTP